MDIDYRGNHGKQEDDNGKGCRPFIVEVIEQAVQGDSQHLRVVSVHQVRGGKGTNVAHENEGDGNEYILVGQWKDHAEEQLHLAGSRVLGRLDDGVRDSGHGGCQKHGGKGDVEPEVHHDHAFFIVHQPQLKIQAEDLADPVDETGIPDDGDHSVDGHQAGNEPGQQVQISDQPADPAFGESQIHGEQIGDHNTGRHGDNHNLQSIDDIVHLNGIGEKVDIVVQANPAFLQLEASSHVADDGEKNHHHQKQHGRKNQEIGKDFDE